MELLQSCVSECQIKLNMAFASILVTSNAEYLNRKSITPCVISGPDSHPDWRLGITGGGGGGGGGALGTFWARRKTGHYCRWQCL